MEADRKVRFGILGAGGISRRFAKALSQSESAELYAVAARTMEGATKFTEEYTAKAYGSYEELLSDPMVDAVYIGVVHTGHFELAMKAIDYKKAVLSEKPFFIHGNEGRILKEKANEEKILVMEGMWTRFLPAYLKVKEWLKNGKIGTLHYMEGDFNFCFPYNEENKNFRLWDPSVAGGAILDAGVYPYEYFTGLMEEHPDKVIGLMDIHETGVDETATMTLHFKSGVIANGMSSICGVGSSSMYIGGEEGHIIQKKFVGGGEVSLYDNKGNLLDSFMEPTDKDGFVYEIEHFSTLLKNGEIESTVIPLADSIDFADAAEKIYKDNGVNLPW